MGVIILGAGGHAKVVADILQLQKTEVMGFLDDNRALWDTQVLGLPVLGALADALQYTQHTFVMGIGSNATRQQLATNNLSWTQAIHPTATIARSARLGQGVVVAAHAVINPDAQVGDHTIINTAATVDHDCVIDNYAHIAPGTHLAGNVRVGAGTLIGIGSSIVPGCIIGAWSVVGAGSTVVTNLPDQVVAKGTPARYIRNSPL